MRLSYVVILFLALAPIAAAQATDTHFPVGPQYLITTDSTLFLRPIATPSLPLASVPAVTGSSPEGTSEAQTSATVPGPASLAHVFWGDWAEEHGAGGLNGVKKETVSEIEITSAEPPRNLPASILDVGVTGMVNRASWQGPGITLGESAAYWKVHKPHATRVFTNRDVERLHGG